MKEVELFIPSAQIENDTDFTSDDLQRMFHADISNREVLFFDELLTAYALVNKDPLEVIDRATLDVHFKDTAGQGQVYNLVTLPLQNPIAIDDDQAKVLFKFEVFTTFPRVPLEEPILKLKLQTTLKVAQKDHEIAEGPKTLPRYFPAERRNILDGLNHSLKTDDKVVLLDSLVKNNQIDIETEEHPELKSTVRELTEELEIPIIRTLNIRIRNMKLRNNSILSTVDIQKSSRSKELELPISVAKLDFKHNLNYNFKPKFSHANHPLPINVAQHDTYSYTFQLHLENEDPIPNFKSLVEVNYTVDSVHKIKTVLITSIDFNSIPQVKRSSTQSLSSLSTNSTPNGNSLGQSLSVKFTGNKIVKLGEPFRLKVHIQNNSSKERNLIMVFNSSQNIDFFMPELPKVKTLIQSNHGVIKNYSYLRVKSIGIVSLVNEIQFKVKPRNMHDHSNINIFENEIELLALELGVFNLQGVRLVDLNTGESLPCDRLLELIVEL